MKAISIYVMSIAAFFLTAQLSNAQNGLENTSNSGIVLNTYLNTELSMLPSYARNVLENKLNIIASQYGMEGGGVDPRFIITPKVTILAKEITPTAPPMTTINLDISLYVGDGITGTLFSSTSVELIGVGTNENKAYISAIRKLNPKHPSIKSLIEQGKKKILNYFNSQCDVIMRRAESLASQNKYQEAIYELASVPAACKDCYNKCARKIGPIYQKQINRDCKSILLMARNAWNAGQDIASAEAASEFLGRIDPSAACYKDALGLSKEIGDRIKDLDQREWDFKMKEATDETNLKADIVTAARDAVVSFGENQPQVEYQIEDWY